MNGPDSASGPNRWKYPTVKYNIKTFDVYGHHNMFRDFYLFIYNIINSATYAILKHFIAFSISGSVIGPFISVFNICSGTVSQFVMRPNYEKINK